MCQNFLYAITDRVGENAAQFDMIDQLYGVMFIDSKELLGISMGIALMNNKVLSTSIKWEIGGACFAVLIALMFLF